MVRIEHSEAKNIFPYVEYSPNEKKEKLPLIIQLHGSSGRGNGGEELTRVEEHGFSEFLKGAECDCVVIMPQCPLDSFWAARVESIIAFIEQMIKKYNADEDKVYLTGLSMGGFGTWYTAMARPDMFAAIAPVCGDGMAWNASVLTMPIWAFHGTEDKIVRCAQTEEMVNALLFCGADVTYTRLEGVEHNAWDYAYQRELMEWLLSKKRTK